MIVVQGAGAPMFAGRQSDPPIRVRKTLPGLQLDHSPETKVMGQITDTPGQHGYFWRWQFSQGGFMEMVEMRMREQDQVDRRQVADSQPGALDPFQKEKPVGEIRIDQDIQVAELHQERSVPDPGQGHMAPG